MLHMMRVGQAFAGRYCCDDDFNQGQTVSGVNYLRGFVRLENPQNPFGWDHMHCVNIGADQAYGTEMGVNPTQVSSVLWKQGGED